MKHVSFLVLLSVMITNTAIANESKPEPIIVDETLVGISGILVAGKSYDVQFVDGSCAKLFKPCGGKHKFAFKSRKHSHDASWSLIDALRDALLSRGQTAVHVKGLGVRDEYNGIDFGGADFNIVTPYKAKKGKGLVFYTAIKGYQFLTGAKTDCDPMFSDTPCQANISTNTTEMNTWVYAVWALAKQ